MLEASGFNKVDQASPFLGSVVDMLCGNERCSEVTAVITLYMEFMSFQFRRLVKAFWTNDTLSKLEEKKKEFKFKTKQVFENYQASKMQTQKWHVLDHIAENIREVGGLEHLHEEMFESADSIYRRHNARSLRKKKSAHEETLHKTIDAANVHRIQKLKCKSDKDNLPKIFSNSVARCEISFPTKAKNGTTFLEIE